MHSTPKSPYLDFSQPCVLLFNHVHSFDKYLLNIDVPVTRASDENQTDNRYPLELSLFTTVILPDRQKCHGAIKKLKAAGPEMWGTHKQVKPPTGKGDSEDPIRTLSAGRKPLQNEHFHCGLSVPSKCSF